MEIQDGLSAYLDPLFQGHRGEGVHDGHNVDVVGALAGAGVAVDADPDGAALQHLLPQAVLDHPDERVGRMVHGCHEGATVGAGAALVAEVQVGPASALYLCRQFPVQLVDDHRTFKRVLG